MPQHKAPVADAIKAFYAKNPDYGPTDAARSVTANIGRKVSASYVSRVRAEMRKGRKRKR